MPPARPAAVYRPVACCDEQQQRERGHADAEPGEDADDSRTRPPGICHTPRY